MSYWGIGIQIESFYQTPSNEFFKNIEKRIEDEIWQSDKKYILEVDENEFQNYLVNRYSLTPLTIDSASEKILEPSKEIVWVTDFYDRSERVRMEMYTFKIIYNFKGTSSLFQLRPHTFYASSSEIYVDDQKNVVTLIVQIPHLDIDSFNKEKVAVYKKAFLNLDNVNKDAQDWNEKIRNRVYTLFHARKSKIQAENAFYSAVNVQVNKETSPVFSTPTIKKKDIPQPTVSNHKEFSSEPTMSKEMYDDLLKVIYASGKGMEKKPSLYIGKHEEDLRDQILFLLETRYVGTTATGETFNRSGKADILLKYAEDNTNLFVAECKFWTGGSDFQEAISQLFTRYLTWRDSKVALILFIRNKDFSNVLKSIEAETKLHPNYVKANGKRGESSFSYIFNLPQDKEKLVFLEIMAFHYDKNK